MNTIKLTFLTLMIFCASGYAQKVKTSSDFRFLKRYISQAEGQFVYENEKLLYQFTKVEFDYVSPEVLKLYFVRMLANGSVDTLDYRFNIKDITDVSAAPILNNNTSQVFITCSKRTVFLKYRSEMTDKNSESYINTFPVPLLYWNNKFFNQAKQSFLGLKGSIVAKATK
jgi:hypothetical protein